MAVDGVIDQGDEITDQVSAGVDAIGDRPDDLDVDLPTGESIVDSGASTGLANLMAIAVRHRVREAAAATEHR